MIALLAALFLVPHSMADVQVYFFLTVSFLLMVVAALFINAKVFGNDDEDRQMVRFFFSSSMARATGTVVALSILGQLCVISGFVMALHSLDSDLAITNAIAASAIVSFIAALPISVNGWGVREVAAVSVFGLLGVGPADALFVSILVGLLSTMSLVLPAPLLFWKTPATRPEDNPDTGLLMRFAALEGRGTALMASSLAMLIAVLIFVYPRIEVYGFSTSINLADPAAMVAGIAFLLHLVSEKHLPRLPQWRLPFTNLWLVLASGTIVLAFLMNWPETGTANWFAVKRLAGWPVLLAYMAAGAFFAGMANEARIARMVGVMATCMAMIIVAETIVRFLGTHTALVSFDASGAFGLYEPVSGFYANRNGFSFLGIITLAGALAYAGKWQERGQFLFAAGIIGILFLGQILTQSRTGTGTAIILLALSFLFHAASRRVIVAGVVMAGIMFLAIFLADLVFSLYGPMSQPWLVYEHPTLAYERNDLFASRAGYNDFRWDTIRDGLSMWTSAPVFGAGLGNFTGESVQRYGQPLVIHSSIVWLLAETGIAGAVIFATQWLRAFRLSCVSSGSPPMRFLMLALIAFALFSAVHDIMYQRIFWFVLGLTLIVPGSLVRRDR